MVPGDLMVNRWVGEHEHFLRDAGPSVARFAPQSGVSLTRALLEDILTRPSAVATLALNWLNGAAVLIEADTLNRMLKRAASLSHPEKPSDGAGEQDWVVSQYLVVAAFALLVGDEIVRASCREREGQ